LCARAEDDVIVSRDGSRISLHFRGAHLGDAASDAQKNAHAAIDAVWRMESARVIAGLARIVRDVGIAEELAQDALVAALEKWPREGVPDNPGAWLMAAAKHRAVDHFRRGAMLERKHEELGRDLGTHRETVVAELHAAIDDDIGDDLLRLIFTACHPVLSPEARVAMTLRLLGGLTTDEVARAFLIPEKTVAQRIARAKRTLSEARVPFEIPHAEERGERLASVLEVIYLIFNEGYAATAGADWMRPTLCEEALRLGRVLAELAPQEAEVHGLVALMEIQASRSRARINDSGEPVLLLDQDRTCWDQMLIRRGLAALDRSVTVGSEKDREGAVRRENHRAQQLRAAPGPYALQAAIAACHARARTAEETDWRRIVEIYTELARISPSPIIDLNRAVAISMAEGPAAGLALVDELESRGELQNYLLLPSVRGDFLFKLNRLPEARAQFQRAASMTRNSRERQLLLYRADACGSKTDL
jgi:RNA polymerase sigma-70 factor (ECF subfamily)